MNEKKTGIILLAAGGSTRLGRPKQLVAFRGMPLIKYAAVTALITELPAVAVLGSSSKRIRKELNDLAISAVVNPEWKKGLSTSIRKGLTVLRKEHSDLEAVIIMLCDQPGVTPDTLVRLAEKYESTGMPIVASKYGDTLGVPALFGYEMFGELLALEGESGAKSLIRRYEDTLVTNIHAPEALIDVDTSKDVESLKLLSAAA